MALVSKPFTFSAGATIVAAQHNSNFDAIFNDYNGNITDANLSASAEIEDSKLAQITTASKVSGAALTSLTSIPSGAGLIPAKNVFPAGFIAMWSGSVATIPSGWLLCNGSNSTPDLRDKFVIGAKQDDGGVAKTNVTGSLTQTGGEAAHTLTVAELPVGTATSGSVINAPAGSGLTSADAAGDAHNTLPPYYALCFIMKS